MTEGAFPVAVPRETVNDDFVIFLGWLVPHGSFVRAGQPIAEIETSKAAVELLAENDGYLIQSIAVNEQVAVGASIGTIATERPTDGAGPTASVAIADQPHSSAPMAQKFSKRAQDLVTEYQLDPGLFAGKTLIREQDVRAVMGAKTANSAAPSGPSSPQTSSRAPRKGLAAPRKGLARIAHCLPLSSMKRTEIRYLAEGNADALVSAVTVIVRTNALDERIQAQNTRRMSYLDFIIPAAARSLRDFRELNAFYTAAGINYYADVNVGTAFNLGKGLLVPVIRNADELPPEEVSRIGSEYAMKYLRGELSENDLSGGTFTVTDLSSAGAHSVFPLINRDQAAILAMGHDTDRRTIVLTLAFDHRVSDGLQATEFLRQIKLALEDGIPREAVIDPTKANRLACGNCFITLERLAATRVTSFLMQVVKPDGSPSYLCPVCLAGWNG